MITTGTVMQTSIDDVRERVSILRISLTRDEMGNIIKSKEGEILSCYAKVLPIASKSTVGQEESIHQITYRIIIRYENVLKIGTIAMTDRVLWRGKKLKLISPPYDAESRRKWYVLECEEMVEDGAA